MKPENRTRSLTAPHLVPDEGGHSRVFVPFFLLQPHSLPCKPSSSPALQCWIQAMKLVIQQKQNLPHASTFLLSLNPVDTDKTLLHAREKKLSWRRQMEASSSSVSCPKPCRNLWWSWGLLFPSVLPQMIALKTGSTLGQGSFHYFCLCST